MRSVSTDTDTTASVPATATRPSPLALARAGLFDAFFYGWTFTVCLVVLPAYPFLGTRGMRVVARVWTRGLARLR